MTPSVLVPATATLAYIDEKMAAAGCYG